MTHLIIPEMETFFFFIHLPPLRGLVEPTHVNRLRHGLRRRAVLH